MAPTIRAVAAAFFLAGLGGALLASGCKEEPPPPAGPPPQCGGELGECDPGKKCNGERQCVADTSYVPPEKRAEQWLSKAREELARLSEVRARRRGGELVDAAEAKPNCDAIRQAYDEAMKLVVEVPHAAYNLGLCAVEANDWGKAEELFMKAAENTDDSAAAVQNLTKLMLRTDRFADAAKLLSSYLDLNPGANDVRANYATVLYLMGKTTEAIEQSREILIRDPAHPGPPATISLARLAQGDIPMALFVIRTGLEALVNAGKPQDPTLLVNLGVIQLKQGDPTAALANFRFAARLDPDHVAAQLNLGNMALRYADFPQAKESFEHVLRWDPDNDDAKIGLAQAQAGSGDAAGYAAARATYEEMTAKYPRDENLLWNYAVLVFLREQNAELGHKLLQRYLDMKPADKAREEKAKVWIVLSPADLVATAPKHERESAGGEAMCVDPNCPEGTDPAECQIPCGPSCPDMTCPPGAPPEECPDVPCEEGYCPAASCPEGERCAPTLCPGRFLCPMPECPAGETCPPVLCPAGMCPADNCPAGKYCEPIECPPEKLAPPDAGSVPAGATETPAADAAPPGNP